MTQSKNSRLPIDVTKLVAHRGLRSKYPENTILAIRKAVEAGASFVELDVQFSKDKLPIIYHDTSLQRVSGSSKSVFECNLADLLKESAYEPDRLGNQFIDETIAALDNLVEILKANPLVIAFVEVKQESIPHCGRQHILDTIETTLSSVADQVVIMSFDYTVSLMARQDHWPLIGVVLKAWDDLDSKSVLEIKADFVFVDHKTIPLDIDITSIEALRNSTLVAYEVSSSQLGYQLLERGVDLLETFELERLMSQD